MQRSGIQVLAPRSRRNRALCAQRTPDSASLHPGYAAVAGAIYAATDLAHEEAQARADAAAQGLIELVPDSPMAAELAYFRANAWSALRQMRGSDAAWDWNGTETQREILHLREAAYHPAFGQLDVVRQCQIETNLGNLLKPRRAVRGRRGLLGPGHRPLAGLRDGAGQSRVRAQFLRRALYDRGHAGVMLLRAYDDRCCASSTS
jgi:hypothetical protein